MSRRVAAVVLAAGLSSRMAPRNKLLLRDAGGQALVGRVVKACCSSRVGEIVVVTGHQAAAVERAVLAAGPGSKVRFVRCADPAQGLSASLRAGIDALSVAVDAALICLGDMPLVTGDLLDRIMAGGDARDEWPIAVPTYHGARGNPVLWDRRFFGELRGLSGDTGGRVLLRRHAGSVVELELGDRAVLVDFDTPEQWDAASCPG